MNVFGDPTLAIRPPCQHTTKNAFRRITKNCRCKTTGQLVLVVHFSIPTYANGPNRCHLPSVILLLYNTPLYTPYQAPTQPLLEGLQERDEWLLVPVLTYVCVRVRFTTHKLSHNYHVCQTREWQGLVLSVVHI